MICKRCGKEVASDMRFCPYCGTQIESVLAEPIENTSSKEEKKNYSFDWGNDSLNPKEESRGDFSFDWESVIDKRTTVGKTFGIEVPKKDTMFKDPEDVKRRTAELNLGNLEKQAEEKADTKEDKFKNVEESPFKFDTGATVSELEKEIFGSYMTPSNEEPKVEEEVKTEEKVEEDPFNFAFPEVEEKADEEVSNEPLVNLDELSEDSKREEEDLEIEKTLIYNRTSLLNQMKEEEEKKEEKVEEDPFNFAFPEVEEVKPEEVEEIAEKVEVNVEPISEVKKDTLVEKQDKFQDLLDKERDRLNDMYGKTSVDLALEENKNSFEDKKEERKEIMDFTESVFNFEENPFDTINSLKEEVEVKEVKDENEGEELSYIFPYVEEVKPLDIADLANDPVKEKEEVQVDLRAVDVNDTRSIEGVSNDVIDQTIIEDSKNMSLEEIYSYEEDVPKKRHIFLKILVTLLVLAVCFEAIVVIMNYFFPDNSFTELVNGIMDKIMNFIRRFI